MKKFLCILMPLLLFFSCGCGEKELKKDILNGISFKATANYKNTEYLLNCKSDKEKITATVIKPKKLKNIYFSVANGEVETQFTGISYKRKIEDFPQDSVICLLYKIFNDINSKEIGEYDTEIKGNADGNEYILNMSEDLLPESLSFKNKKLNIKFSDVIKTDR